ncbi:MAG: OadG family protein [Oscillospiraceae bacterium]|nr:OadG family protein [Oscillospiraceae bacterium]
MTYLAATAVDLENISIMNAGIVAVLGYAVVFFGLILLMLVIMAMGKAFTAQSKKPVAKKETAPVAAAPAAAPAAVVEAPAAPGSAGPVKLYDTPPKTAAMIMAIVANQMGKPLNELRFISIKEVKD